MRNLRRRLERRVPPLARAFTRYVLRTRDPYLPVILRLRSEVDATIDRITAELFEEVEAALERARGEGEVSLVDGAEAVRFDYDTRLVLPAMLTLGRVHELAGDVPALRHLRRTDAQLVADGREVTRGAVRALLDGDMRDAINDGEFEDFETTVRPRPRAAEIAQETLQSGVESWLDDPDVPDGVESAYRHAVELSEGHQATDREFRSLLARYNDATGDDRLGVAEEIESRYKYASPAEEPALFEAERHLPYFVTQYERVGVLYEDMLRIYEAALGIELGVGFKRAIVLMVIAAQVGLDDVDDYPEDRGEQLTPVTAELALDGADGVATVERVVDRYLDRAAEYADTHLAGMAIAYIREDAHDRIATLPAAIDG